MMAWRDNFSQSVDALRAHKLRAALTVLGLTMGVTTLITVMTLVQGANVYVEKKIANLGTNVFQVGRVPFAVTDFNLILKALRYKYILRADVQAVAEACPDCKYVGATASTTAKSRAGDKELEDINLYGHTANMAEIDSRTVISGRYFTESEDTRNAPVCVIGQKLVEELFPNLDPLGKLVHIGNQDYTVIGTFEKIGNVLGQDQDSFAVIPMGTFLKTRGTHNSLIINVMTTDAPNAMERAQDEARQVMRARRHITGAKEEDFFFGTKDSYIALWQSISGAFFAVFVMVSSISALVGGIVIMNVMLVSVTERTKEIGVRRALGATQADILREFLTESVMQCIIGGTVGILLGFGAALGLRTFTEFPAAVQTWVAVLGVFLSSVIGLFFGIYPATRASRLDPVVALRAD
ncbi:MAG: ABC transporter permease [Bryobacteraceae bacterium]